MKLCRESKGFLWMALVFFVLSVLSPAMNYGIIACLGIASYKQYQSKKRDNTK